jgi:FixJ family two-component response regulator
MHAYAYSLDAVAVPAPIDSLTPTVYLVDDDDAVRRSLTRLLTAAGIPAVAFRSAEEYLEGCPRSAAGCLLLDLSMPDCSGLELQELLGRNEHTLPVVFLTGYGDVPSSVRAMKSGAIDFLTKPVDKKLLLAAVRAAFARDEVARQRHAVQEDLQKRLARLTPRENEVVRLVARGMLNKQIAIDLGTVEKTVKVHRARGLAKLEVSSVADLVRLLERSGPVPA